MTYSILGVSASNLMVVILWLCVINRGWIATSSFMVCVCGKEGRPIMTFYLSIMCWNSCPFNIHTSAQARIFVRILLGGCWVLWLHFHCIQWHCPLEAQSLHGSFWQSRYWFCVNELTTLFNSYDTASSMECIALKAAMVMSALLLQRPHRDSKSHDHIACLECCLPLWHDGNIKTLLDEGIMYYSTMSIYNSQDTARVFAKLTFQGKVKAALRFVSDQSQGFF